MAESSSGSTGGNIARVLTGASKKGGKTPGRTHFYDDASPEKAQITEAGRGPVRSSLTRLGKPGKGIGTPLENEET